MEWYGRQMTSYSKGNVCATFTYDADGLRGSKTVNGAKTTYFYVGDKLYYQHTAKADGTTNYELYFYYDSYDNLSAIKYYLHSGTTVNEYTYYVSTNTSGDVLGLYGGDGILRVAYEYDAWGNVISVTDADENIITNPNSIAHRNPIRYRGYYYDTETGFYYLQSRYYCPKIGRFLNADVFVTTGQGVISYNMFAYCLNNPVMYSDPTGCVPWFIVAAVVAVVAIGAAVVVDCLTGNNVFGASASSTTTVNLENPIIPDPIPITVETGDKTSSTDWSTGDSTKPISVYANAEKENLLFSSSAGIVFNISDFSMKFNLAADNISVSGSVKNNNYISGLSIKGNLTKFKIGIEKFDTEILGDGIENTIYTNVSVSGYLIAFAYAYITTGVTLPSSGYQYAEAY